MVDQTIDRKFMLEIKSMLEELTEENAALKRKLATSNKRLASYQSYKARQYRYDNDYLSYNDEDYDR